MTEPTYNYIPGIGWVPNGMQTTHALSKDSKTKITIEKRAPKHGEVFVIGLDSWALPDFVAHVGRYDWHSATKWDDERTLYPNDNIVTLILEPND